MKKYNKRLFIKKYLTYPEQCLEADNKCTMAKPKKKYKKFTLISLHDRHT